MKILRKTQDELTKNLRLT